MFEKLAGNVLSGILSKYFTEDSLTQNKVLKKTQLGVWSGFVSLKDLEVKREVINRKLHQKGQPLELMQCTFRHVEITIPWAKLTNPIGGSFNNGSGNGGTSVDDDAVAVFVVDGVHALFRISFQFHDDELRDEAIKERRKALSMSESFAKSASSNVEEYYSSLEEAVGNKSYMETLKQRISSGLLQEIAKRLHIHLRDLHVRFEDKESDPENPFAFGITMESMHLQHDEEEDVRQETNTTGVVSKVAQMNHFAAYWNPLGYGHGLPAEHSLLHEICAGDNEKLSRALDSCIARRGSLIPSPSKKTYIPKHTYLLLPVDGYLHALLSTTPKDLTARPAVDIAIQLDTVSTQLRDFQCVQMLKLYGERRNFNFVKRYRKYRPTVSVMKDAKAWWKYAAYIIRLELKGSMLRWSWQRFQRSYALRERYMDLYEKRIRQSDARKTEDSIRISESIEIDALTEDEFKELQDLEDGIAGELTVSDIILYRAMVNMRRGNAARQYPVDDSNGRNQKFSWLRQTVKDATIGDAEAKDEFERLMEYMNKIPTYKLVPESRNDTLTSIAVVVQLEEINLELFSPLSVTSEETQLKRIHEKFFDVKTKVTRIGGTLKGDYKRFDMDYSIMDLVASEVRLDKTHHTVASRSRGEPLREENDTRSKDSKNPAPLFLCAFSKKPVASPEVDKEARMFLDPIEIVLDPECQWIAHLKQFVKTLTTVSNVQKFWRELSVAHLNSLTLGKLGLVAKAESAASNHENIDIDFNLHCPIIRCGMGDDGDLILDLGTLCLKTDKLAGISHNKFRHEFLLRDRDSPDDDVTSVDRWDNGIEEASLAGSVSVRTKSLRKRPKHRFLFPSGMSVESFPVGDRGNQSFSGSFNLEDTFVQSNDQGKDGRDETELQDLFYDRYQMLIRMGKITFVGEFEVYDISPGFEIRTAIHKSVLPTDHTLCKMKVHTALGSIRLFLNEGLLSQIGAGVWRWKSLVVTDVSSPAFRNKRNEQTFPAEGIGDLVSGHMPFSEDDDLSEEGTSSIVDENEFFDAHEGADSVAGENSGVWFEDNWIADAESVIDGESRSGFSGRRGRRRPPSVSDMSSVSDHSAGRPRKSLLDNGYLSAENLARLEEAADDEDDSVGESGNDNDDDSFHSVMPPEAHQKLLRDLQNDIEESQTRIRSLSDSLKAEFSEQVTESQFRERRKARKETRRQLHRAKAELKALQVLSSDLQSLLEGGVDDKVGRTTDEDLVASRKKQAKTALALLRVRKRREAAGSAAGHSLVRNLNRELLKGSVIISKIRITMRLRHDTLGAGGNVERGDIDANNSEFDFVANQVGIALFSRVNETKAYFSLDQVSSKVEIDQDVSLNNSFILLSGGTSDTFLPTHLPHLIAHSMEDRFLRGAIDIKRSGKSEALRHLRKSIKIRLVVGDLEISPYSKCLVPLFRCVARVKESIVTSELTKHEETPLQAISETSRHSKIDPFCLDLAVRLASIRVVMCQIDTVVGAAALTEASFRFMQISSPIQQKFQVDLRCTNVQLLDVSNLDTGRGSEILGRRDPYNALVQVRMRSQIVPQSERGGWVIGEEKGETKIINLESKDLLRNFHVGVRINPLAIIASTDALSKLVSSLQELKSSLSSINRTAKGMKSIHQHKSSSRRPLLDYPWRWRADVSARRVNIRFPCDSTGEWGISDDVGTKMLVALSIVLSAQESEQSRESFLIRLGVSDISMIRPSDDWPILEPFAVICELLLQHQVLDSFRNGSNGPLSLFIRKDSPLAEMEAAMQRHGWDSIPIRKTDDASMRLILKLTPVKANISAPVIALLADISKTMTSCKLSASSSVIQVTPMSNILSESNDSKTRFSLQISIEDIEIQLLREMESKPMALATPLISFTLTDAAVDFSQGDQVTASVLIRDSALFDLSCGKGIRVIGEDPEARLEFPYFVRVKLYMHYGPQTIRLHINWGRIQCLILPSFVRSLLDLADALQHLRGQVGQTLPSQPQSKEVFLSRFLHHPCDVNLILSADAETFECILASRDVIDYVKNAAREPIGVVSFRWKASLSVAFALDCLLESSMPWLTLNLDGVFTDEDDSDLFKDFSNRYLVHEGNGSGALVDELVNVFTLRVSHRLSSFQALRTNIVRMDLATSSRRGFVAMPRICFKISQPSAGEQRITNPIDFMLLYRTVGATIPDDVTPGTPEVHLSSPKIEMAQLLNMRANFVDVLLYIQSRSTGGFTDSYGVSIKPIFDMFKGKESRRIQDIKETPRQNRGKSTNKSPRIIDLVKRAPSVCTFHVEGFQVTCVPGGASSLNESPIIKFELSRVLSGMAAVPVQQDLARLPGGGPSSSSVGSPSRKFISGLDTMNMTLAGWVGFQVTGHYHNRRLVAWEPFIEPWGANARFGIDLVEVLRWKPVVKCEGKLSMPAPDSGSPSLTSNEAHPSSVSGKDRFRDFGRLLRSPFQQGLQSPGSPRKGPTFISHSDFCYLMLSSSARTSMMLALYPTGDSPAGNDSLIFSTMPTLSPLDWLQGFGQPAKSGDLREMNEPFSISVAVSDKRPLNINLTGALVENVLGYMDHGRRVGSKVVVPHLIRNDTGMTIRIREVLDSDRSKRGESAAKIILANGAEAPLTLKRSLSQTCDPHRAYIHLEIGNFEDTIGRVNHDDFEVPKGTRSSSFFFKAAAKIPVDAVGVHRYPLDRNVDLRPEVKSARSDSRALGWIIVRVALKGSVKVVWIESPFVLKSAADADLLCEVRDQTGLSLLWRCLIPKKELDRTKDGIYSVPADIVPFIHDGLYRLSVIALPRSSSYLHEAEVVSTRGACLEISTPPPFSSDSFGKGLIGEEEIALPTLGLSSYPDFDSNITNNDYSEKIHLTVCAIRIGTVNLSPVDTTIEVPEQRMIYFRSPLVIMNFLALPIAVQVRMKSHQSTSLQSNTSNSGEQKLIRRMTLYSDWEDLGVLDCGASVHWTGSLASNEVQMRVRFVGTDGDNSRRFPEWSSTVEIPARSGGPGRAKNVNLRVLSKIKVLDAENTSLSLSVAIELGNNSLRNQLEEESIRDFCHGFSSATRVVSLFVPYWIVDGTRQDLEFYAGSAVAGQLEGVHSAEIGKGNGEFGTTLGLAELMDNQDFLETSSKSEFDVLMVGEDNSSRLTVRKRLARKGRLTIKTNASPWSDPIVLSSQKKQHDITVLSRVNAADNLSISSDDPRSFDRLVLRSRVVNATEKFGGSLGTKLIHVVNRYAVLNETGRDIEIDSNGGTQANISVNASSHPQPFHFDDSRPVRFRFKEYGWTWSGYFNIRSSRREVTMRLRHKMRAQSVIATVELRAIKKSATSLLVFRQSNHPPFRLENHTMHPLQFGQSLSILGQDELECDSLLLQYQNADFAWDEPELRRRALVVKASGPGAVMEDTILGRFLLDKIAPGTAIKLDNDKFAAEIVADGPTRVLRISDASMPRVSSFRQDEFDYFQHAPEVVRPLTFSIVARIAHGIGISVVDFSPKELLYARLDDIFVEKRMDTRKDDVSFSVGSIKLNNQLWVTPYPVLLKMGRHFDSRMNVARRKNRRHDAVAISWRSSLNTHGGYGNVTILDKIEVSSEPVFINVDGELANLLYQMAQDIASIRSHKEFTPSPRSRDEELKELLAIGIGTDSSPEKLASSKGENQIQGDPFCDPVATVAAASKLTAHSVYAPSTPRWKHFAKSQGRKRSTQPVSKAQHKIYIQHLRISTTRADLSWSGPLPGLVSSLLFRALTFERLPVRLRPFSSSHAYGNLHDHLQMLRSHYLSIWRVSDLLMGLSSNPTFLFRAVIYTFRETCASVLDSCASVFEESSSMITKLATRDAELQATYFDKDPSEETKKHIILKQTVLPFANAAVLGLGNLTSVLSWLSSHLKYGTKSGSALRTRGFVRSRNPRLFAHLDGKDLLVEYVEGENAGKALLSRVRMGLHLGEGYFFHAEGARQRRAYSKLRTDLDSEPLILMMTSERVLLLTGRLDRNFCSVVWESYFANTVNVTIVPADELSTFTYDEIVIWHLCDPDFSEGNETDDMIAKRVVSGIDVLHKKSIYVPRLVGKQVLKKMHSVDHRLGY